MTGELQIGEGKLGLPLPIVDRERVGEYYEARTDAGKKKKKPGREQRKRGRTWFFGRCLYSLSEVVCVTDADSKMPLPKRPKAEKSADKLH